MRRLLKALALAGLGFASLGATQAWLGTVAATPEGHRLGNPDAKVKLVAYESYTCPHCAHFERQGGDALKLAYIQPGKVSLEVRHHVRDPVDLTAAILTECVAPNRFFDAHRAFYAGFDKWTGVMTKATKAQTDRWYAQDGRAARRSIASDLGFYAIVAPLGLTRAQADKCLNDEVLAKKITDLRVATNKKYPAFEGTPSFMINGVLLYATNEWSILKVQIDARL